jgi:translation initiation factor 3 subunit I
MSKKAKEHSSVKQFSLNGHSRPVNMVLYNKDGDMFFSCSNDKLIIAWDNETAEKVGVYEGPSACKSLAISKNTEYVIGSYGMEGIVIYEALTGNKVFNFKPAEGTRSEYIEFSQGDSELLTLVTKDAKSSIIIYDFKKLLSGEKKVKKAFNFDSELSQASYGYLNTKLYVSTLNGKMKIIDLQSEETELDEPIHPGQPIFSFTFSKDYSMLATCGKEGK